VAYAMQPPNVHDALVKTAFSQVQHAEGFLRLVLPPALVARIDFSTLALRPGSFVDEALKERHSDLLYSVAISGRSALLYVLFEHKSKPEDLVPFFLLRYMTRVWERWLRDHPGARAIPVIAPVVLHHGEGGWRRATAFEELYDVDPATLAALGEHAVRFRFALDDISFADDDALKARAMSAFARLVLFCLRHVREPAVLLQRLGRWVDLVGEARRAPNGPAALVALFRYILETNRELEPEAIVEQLLAAVGEEGKEQILSAGEKLIERGRQEGLQKGLQKGRQEGHQEGLLKGRREERRELLLKLLGTRFGALPAHVVARVNEADLDQLERWFDRIIAAPSLAAVFE
jgi:predicted transposase/invertase (TIGR01784 family)